MSRLTERFSNGQAAVVGCGKNCKHNYEYCHNWCCPTLNEIYEKLAFYEDLEDKGVLPIMYGVNCYPCNSCGLGWASISASGCKSCHENCEKLAKYFRKEFEKENDY